MEQRYCIMNECLGLLKKSDLPAIKKLRVEIQLYQMKRLLLIDAAFNDHKSGYLREDVFEDLLCQMRRVCGRSWAVGDLVSLFDHIDGMMTVLSGDQVPPLKPGCMKKAASA